MNGTAHHWFILFGTDYEDGKFYAVSNSSGTKIRSLKKNPEVYFLVDITDRGVRGKARANIIDDPEYAKKITSRNLIRYMGSAVVLKQRTALN